jgi:hypothetical protein
MACRGQPMDEGYSEGSWRKLRVLKPDASCSSRKSMVAYFDKNSILIRALFHKFPVNPNLGELYDGADGGMGGGA